MSNSWYLLSYSVCQIKEIQFSENHSARSGPETHSYWSRHLQIQPEEIGCGTQFKVDWRMILSRSIHLSIYHLIYSLWTISNPISFARRDRHTRLTTLVHRYTSTQGCGSTEQISASLMTQATSSRYHCLRMIWRSYRQTAWSICTPIMDRD